MAVPFPINDPTGDCGQIINGVPASQGPMPDIDIVSLARNDLQIIMNLDGTPVLDSKHVYYIYIVWDQPAAGPFLNMTLCVGGGFEGDTTVNGSYTMLFNSEGAPVFVEDNQGIIDPGASNIIWVVDQSMVQNPNNPYSVVSWTLKNISASEYWVDSWPDDYWTFSPPPTTSSPPPTTSTPPTTSPPTTSTPTTGTGWSTSFSFPGLTITVAAVGLSVATITFIVIRKKRK